MIEDPIRFLSKVVHLILSLNHDEPVVNPVRLTQAINQ